MVFFMEIKLDKNRMARARRRLGFVHGIKVEADGTRGGLCLGWKEDMDVTLRSFSKNHIDMMV